MNKVKVTMYTENNLTIISGKSGSGKTSLLWKIAEGSENSLSILFETNPKQNKLPTKHFVQMPIPNSSEEKKMVKELIRTYSENYNNLFIDHLPISSDTSMQDLIDVGNMGGSEIYICVGEIGNYS